MLDDPARLMSYLHAVLSRERIEQFRILFLGDDGRLIVDEAQAATVRDTLAASGFGCEETGGATICRIEQRGVSLDDLPFERGEVQAVSGELWVTTAWINVDPEGYTEDILSTVAE